MREVSCPACGHKIEVSQKALSLRCPACTQPIQLDDFVLEQSTEGRLKTMGLVAIAPGCDMSGEVVCGAFRNEGQFEGQVLVYGTAALLAGSQTQASVTARAFEAAGGSTFVGRLMVGPRVGLAPTDAHRFDAPASRDQTARVPAVVILRQTATASPQVV